MVRRPDLLLLSRGRGAIVDATLELLPLLGEVIAQRGVGLGVGRVGHSVAGAHAVWYEASPLDVRFRLANAPDAKAIFLATFTAIAHAVRENGGPGRNTDDGLFVVLTPRLCLGKLSRIQDVGDTRLKLAGGRDGCDVVDSGGFTTHIQ